MLFTPLARSFEADHMCAPFREACFYELARQLAPGFVRDVHIIPGVASWAANVVFQVKKRRPRDEGVQRDILTAFLGTNPILQTAIAVDEDVDIFDQNAIEWVKRETANLTLF